MLTYPAGNIELTSPLNVTAPRKVTTGMTGDLPEVESNVVSTPDIRNEDGARKTLFFLLNYDVDYVIRDQFGDEITESERGEANVTVREEVPFTSSISPGLENLQAFFNHKIQTNTTQAWKVKRNGEINDALELGPLTATILKAPKNTLKFIPRARNTKLCEMKGHVWYVSVNGDPKLEKRVTKNNMLTKVIDFKSLTNGESVLFGTVYTVVLEQ